MERKDVAHGQQCSFCHRVRYVYYSGSVSPWMRASERNTVPYYAITTCESVECIAKHTKLVASNR